MEYKSSVHERHQVIKEKSQADVDFLCLLYLLKQQSTNSNQEAAPDGSYWVSSCVSCALDSTEANIISTPNFLLFGGHRQHVQSSWNCLSQHNPGGQKVHECARLQSLQIEVKLIRLRSSRFIFVVIITNVSYLLLFDQDGPNLSCNHRDNCGDVIFKSVREATSARNIVLVQLGHMLSHAFHLFETITHPLIIVKKRWKTQSLIFLFVKKVAW